ncbi:Protein DETOXIFICATION 12 [Zea mays]|uniref:Protein DETOXIFICATION 12 n=1 Tax=Zea mays TaxID=4577 RepID=A0A1D6JQN7_MAIZE|nr:Protein DETOXIFICATION 12 [Zea mays]
MGSSSGAPLLVAHPSRGKEDLGDQRRLRWCCGVSSEGRWAEATAEAGRLAALAAPMIAVALLQLMMQVISTIMVGHLGEVPLAGAAIAGSLTNVSGFSVLYPGVLVPGSKGTRSVMVIKVTRSRCHADHLRDPLGTRTLSIGA